MSRMISVRVSDEMEREVARLARTLGHSESWLVREAIEAYVASQPAASPYEALKDVIGCVDGGPNDLSEKTGEKVRALLVSRRTKKR
jgi:hypothetical protein